MNLNLCRWCGKPIKPYDESEECNQCHIENAGFEVDSKYHEFKKKKVLEETFIP